jgi:hypothetical protein
VLIEPTSPGPGNPAISIVLSFFKLFRSAIVMIFVDVGVPDVISSPEYVVEKEFINQLYLSYLLLIIWLIIIILIKLFQNVNHQLAFGLSSSCFWRMM